METPELPEQPIDDMLPVITLNAEAKYFLHTSGKWASFLGILGFILTGFIVLIALFMGSIFSIVAKMQPTAVSSAMPAGVGGLFGFFYLLIAAFYFVFSLYLYQFGSRIKSGISYSNEVQVADALGKLKSFFKLWGITTIVIIALYILIIIIVVIVAVAAPHMATSSTITFAK